NPSTEDMLNAIAKVNADNIFILPNNKNIIMAANQAGNMTEDKKVIVIPTKTVPQGISAVINYVPDLSADDNAATMECEIRNVSTGQVTYAVRDTVIDDTEIHEGDYMGIGDKGILSVGTDQNETALNMVSEMMDDDKEIISIYYGIDVTQDEAKSLSEEIRKKYPSADVDLQYGGQPIYYYIISVE
ncbi:MAG: DAK2 domain-containing protein, partial [Lachnospiraceae bacterium]|nr:DAK2 domain-containing protein [Lachnospiraceae bacterium]